MDNKSKVEVYSQRSLKDGEINWQDSSKKLYDFIKVQILPFPCSFKNKWLLI